jgi:hypothetical protein
VWTEKDPPSFGRKYGNFRQKLEKIKEIIMFKMEE